MFEWWQTVVLSLGTLIVGGVIAVSSGYLQHRWATDAARKAEERQAAYRVREEERQYIRQHRRERMKPVLDFLEVVKRYAGEAVVINRLRENYKRLSGSTGTLPITWEEFEKETRKDWSVPDFFEVFRRLCVALLVSPTKEVEAALFDALVAVLLQEVRGKPAKGFSDQQASDAIRAAEQLVERYLAEV
jgi:hypothetical protein